MASISASVGWNGVNKTPDVKAVQDLLNTVPVSRGGPKVPVDATAAGVGSPTFGIFVNNIIEFQRFHFSWEPDGRVDPGKKTWQRLLQEAGGDGGTGVAVDYDMIYEGQFLTWKHNLPPGVAGEIKVDATSGMAGFQFAHQQTQMDAGPIPEGRYSLRAQWTSNKDRKARIINNAGDLDREEGIQLLPHDGLAPNGRDRYDYPEWGRRRVRLKPEGKIAAPHRSGFYLHDSHKGYTHGCVEVLEDFFAKYLIPYAEWSAKPKTRLVLVVKYATPGTSTRGNTKRPRYANEYYPGDDGGWSY
jgi:hypothetical protein